jgi:hypothetical protein
VTTTQQRVLLGVLVTLAIAYVAWSVSRRPASVLGSPQRLFTVPPGETASPNLRLEPGYYYWINVTPDGDFEWWRRRAWRLP